MVKITNHNLRDGLGVVPISIKMRKSLLRCLCMCNGIDHLCTCEKGGKHHGLWKVKMYEA